MRLRTKIQGGYGAVLLLLFGVWGWAVFNLYDLGAAGEAILQENYKSILAAENMIDNIERQDSASLLLILGFADEGLEQFRRNEIEFLEWLSRAKDNITLEGEKKTLEDISENYKIYLVAFSDLSERVSNRGDVRTYYHEKLLPVFKQVRDTCIKIRDLNQDAMVMAADRAHRLSVRAILSMSLIGFIAAALGFALSLLLSGLLARPLAAMSAATEKIAGGDYDVALRAESNDELGILARQIMHMSDKLKSYHELNVSQLIAEKTRGEAILHSISDGIVVVDENLNILSVNSSAASIFNASPEEAKGKHFFDVAKSKTLYTPLREAVEAGAVSELDPEQTVFTVQRGSRSEHYHFSITPIKTARNKPLGFVMLLQNVTRLKELDRLKSEFVMTASHELRTPLTGIAMSIGLLREKAEAIDSDDKKLLDAADEEVQRLRALVDDLLDLSKIESGRMEMEMELVGAELIVEKAASAFDVQMKEKGIELSVELPKEKLSVKADPNKIAWVLANFLSNALRYVPGGGHVKVSAEQARENVYFRVKDDGPGIPVEYQSKIFDKFVRVKNDGAVGGTGLGLPIAKAIVRAHGGCIWVDSREGEGSAFTFSLPLAGASPAKLEERILI